MLIFWVVLGFVIPVILLFCHIVADNGSINNANNDEESGHPCLVPLWSVIGCCCRRLPEMFENLVG